MQLARNLAVEWGPHNIRVNCIAPGLVKTDFARALWEDPKLLRKASENRTALRRHRRAGGYRGSCCISRIARRALDHRTDHRDRRRRHHRMKAAILREFGNRITMEDVPTPVPGPGRGADSRGGVRRLPFGSASGRRRLGSAEADHQGAVDLGHEVAGVVAELGEGVTRSESRRSRRRAVDALDLRRVRILPARAAKRCACKQKITGCTVDGGFAEYLIAPATHAEPLAGFVELRPKRLRCCARASRFIKR